HARLRESRQRSELRRSLLRRTRRSKFDTRVIRYRLPLLLLRNFCRPSRARARVVQAQERRWISILHSGFPDRTPIHFLFEALRAHGFEDGRSATVELLGGEGDPERLKSLIAQLTSQKPDVIIALTPPAALGLKQAGTTIPVVFADVPDPVGLGLVNSLAHPGGNFTGITYTDPRLGGKRLEILLDAVPGVKRVAVIGGVGSTDNGAPHGS